VGTKLKQQEHYLHMGNNSNVFFSLPEMWSLVYEPQSDPKLSETIADMTRTALAEPRGGPSLDEIVAQAREICILVDDGTRPTPVREILPVLLERIGKTGFPHEKVAIVIALGSHAPLSMEALEARLGKETVTRYSVVQHNAWQADLVPFAVDGIDSQVKINPAVLKADTRIGISSILPHPRAGFGGGPKILMPGVCDVEFFTRHHMTCSVNPKAQMGSIKENPFFEICMRIAEAVGIDLSINCVYNRLGILNGIVAGSLRTAYGEAVRRCHQLLGARCSRQADITITSSYPHTHGVQFCKSLGPPELITKPNGAVLLAVPTADPVSEQFVAAVARVREEYGSVDSVREVMARGQLPVPDQSPEYNMALYDLIGRSPERTVIVSSGISRDVAARLGFDYAASIREGIEMLEKAYPKADVALFPAGGLVIPSVAV
jgi:lactate racemase